MALDLNSLNVSGLSQYAREAAADKSASMINDATANQTGYTSISFLNEISSRTDNTNECKFISNFTN